MDDERPDLELRHYLRILRRRLPVVLLVTALVVGVAVAISATSTRIYGASADVLVADPAQQTSLATGVASGSSSAQSITAQIPTEIELMRARAIRQAVAKDLGHSSAEISGVDIEQVGETNLMRVTVESASPTVARRAANAYAREYVTTRRKQAVDATLAAGKVVQDKLNDLQNQLTQLDAQIGASPVPPANLVTQRDTVTSQIEFYKQQLDQLQVAEGIRQGGGAQVVSTAVTPTNPVKPRPVRDGLLGLALGLMLGIALAFLAEFLDDKINTAEDITRYGDGLTVLAEIPTIARDRDRRRLVALENPNSGATEAYRSLRTSIRIIGLRSPVRSLLVTSPMANEGKTTTVANLGVTMARAGWRVALVDLDMRRARLGPLFGIQNNEGLMSVLAGEIALPEALTEVEVAAGVPGLQVLPTGELPPNPSEIMGTNRLREVLDSLNSWADIVIIDTPPLVPVTDALVLSERVDGVLLVVEAGSTRRRHLQRATQLLQQAQASVYGAVLNGAGSNQRYSYYRGYGFDGHTNGNGAKASSTISRDTTPAS
jgi:succinoglycan biosynthesis transport protein ExoP